MKFLTIFLSLFLLADSPDKDSFDWLVGTWEGVNNTEQEQSFEIWEKLGSQTYRGIGYTLEDGDTVFMEKLSIENVLAFINTLFGLVMKAKSPSILKC